MWEKHFLYGRRQITDMNDCRTVGPHEKGRFLNRVVANRQDQIGLGDGLVDIIAFRKSNRPYVKVSATRGSAFTHLRREEGNTQAMNKIGQRFCKPGATGSCA